MQRNRIEGCGGRDESGPTRTPFDRLRTRPRYATPFGRGYSGCVLSEVEGMLPHQLRIIGSIVNHTGVISLDDGRDLDQSLDQLIAAKFNHPVFILFKSQQAVAQRGLEPGDEGPITLLYFLKRLVEL